MQNRIKNIMSKKSISVEQLADMTKIGRTTIYQIIASKCNTNVEYALRISKALGRPVSELFFSDEE